MPSKMRNGSVMAKDILENKRFTDEFYLAVGHLVIWSGRLEFLLKLTIKNLLGQGFSVGMEEAERERNFKPLCEKAINEVGKQKTAATLDPAVADTLTEIFTAAINLSDFRNDTVHAYWLQNQITLTLYRVRPDIDKLTKKLTWAKSADILLPEIEAKSQDFENLYWKLDEIRRKIP